jgi:ribosomal protein S18 acetylase RimI-like enzyme
MTDIVIRKASRKDIPALVRLYARDGEPAKDFAWQKFNRGYFGKLIHDRRSLQLVALRGKELVGGLTVNYIDPIEKYAVVGKLVIRRDAHRQGIGRRLMQAMEGSLRKLGTEALFANAWQSNKIVAEFNRSVGFRNIGAIVLYAKRLRKA